MKRPGWLAGVACGLLIAGAVAVWLAWPEPLPPGVSRDTARLIRQLRAKPGSHQRVVTRLARRIHPRVVNWLPAFLRSDLVGVQNLEACHRLMTLGPELRPAVPLLLGAFRDPDSSVSFYAFLVVVYSGLPPAEFALLARQPPATPTGPVHFYAGLLTTEDERLRDYAWACLEASGDSARAVRPRLRELEAESDPAVRRRATALLTKLEGRLLDDGAVAMPPDAATPRP
jgi:hypothetical protein